MKCDDKDERLGACTRLDHALHQLGMLSAITDARRDYLHEDRSHYGLVRMDTRFVSNVTVGYCMRRVLRHRVCPYALPLRHRTKSENSDSKEDGREESDATPGGERVAALKRSQSLESLGKAESASETRELDGVSHRIEKLQVEE